MAEEALSTDDDADRSRQEIRRLNHLLNSSPYPIWQWDRDLQLSFCNERFSEVIEPDGDDIIDMGKMELFRGHREMAARAQQTASMQQEERYIISQGQRRLYRITEIPASDGKVHGYAVDITETDDAREEIQRYITAQRDFLESSTSAMAVFGGDQRLLLYNPAFSRLWQLDEAFLNTKPGYGLILERLREMRRLPEQANFQAFKQHQLRWFTELVEPHEEFFYLPDGKTLRVVMIPHALGGLLIAYEDVTDRLALERSYNTLIAVQQETLDNIDESVMVIGEDGRVKLCNPAFLKLWQLSESDMRSEPHIRDALEFLKPLLPFDDWQAYKETYLAKLQLREAASGKLSLRNGKHLIWRKVPLPDGGTLLAHSDITDSEQLERSLRERNQALEAADQLKTQFLANVSYELRSPLTSICGFSDILRNEYFGALNDKQREYAEGIHASSQQLTALIDDILDLASIEAGYMQLEIAEFSISEMLNHLVTLVLGRARALQIHIVMQCPDDIGELEADETRIRQVLFNLLNNAFKYSDRGSTVTLSAEAEGESVLLIVSDNGVGIESEKLGEIFERFSRAGASRGQQSGSGLGLSLVKSFIELHHGSVQVASKPGEGTTFTCRLPRRYQPPRH